MAYQEGTVSREDISLLLIQKEYIHCLSNRHTSTVYQEGIYKANAFHIRYDELVRERYENAAQPRNADLPTCSDLYKVADLLITLFAIQQTFGVRHWQ